MLFRSEVLLQQAQQLVNMEREQQRMAMEQQAQAERLRIVEAKQTTRVEGMYSIAGYASLIGRRISTREASEIARKAVKMSRDLAYPIDTTSDPRWGKVNVYHQDILRQVISEVPATVG